MAIDKVFINSINAPINTKKPNMTAIDAFKKSMEKASAIKSPAKSEKIIDLKAVIDHAISDHKKAIAMVEKALLNNNADPDRLLKFQYHTGIFFLREQMFSKTAELSASTLKNFMHMQV